MMRLRKHVFSQSPPWDKTKGIDKKPRFLSPVFITRTEKNIVCRAVTVLCIHYCTLWLKVNSSKNTIVTKVWVHFTFRFTQKPFVLVLWGAWKVCQPLPSCHQSSQQIYKWMCPRLPFRVWKDSLCIKLEAQTVKENGKILKLECKKLRHIIMHQLNTYDFHNLLYTNFTPIF